MLRTQHLTIFRRYLITGFLALNLLANGAAAAELLVLADGSRIQTRGPFEEVRGQIRFTDVRGRLASLRVADVDLEATRVANQRALTAESEVPAEDAGSSDEERAARPVLVLTNANIGSADPEEIRRQIELLEQDVEEYETRRKRPTVNIYTTSWCTYCRAAISFLREKDIRYREYDVEKSAAAKRSRDRIDPSCGVPLIVVGTQSQCGFSSGGWIVDTLENAAERADTKRSDDPSQ